MEKDMTEKMLEDYEDVFADIVNVLLFDGERRMKEQELERAAPRSVYKADGKLREQERDVAKYWRNNDIRIAFLGFENETAAEDDMPFRVIGYDGAAYRDQIFYEKGEDGKRRKSTVRYPVLSLVLYFGTERWDKARSLYEALGDRLDKDLEPYIHDYKINLFEIAFLTDEQVEKFQSDFKIVADYFVQVRKNKDYKPSETKIRHVRELMQLMNVLTGDSRFEEAVNEAENREKDGKELKSMCEVLDRVEQRGIDKGKKEALKVLDQVEQRGIDKGKKEGKKELLLELVRDNVITLEEASKRSEKNVEELKKML